MTLYILQKEEKVTPIVRTRVANSSENRDLLIIKRLRRQNNYHCPKASFRTMNKSLPICAMGIIKDELAFKHFDFSQHPNSFLKQTTSK